MAIEKTFPLSLQRQILQLGYKGHKGLAKNKSSIPLQTMVIRNVKTNRIFSRSMSILPEQIITNSHSLETNPILIGC